MKYELMVILKPLLPEDVKSKLITDVEDLVKGLGGKVGASDVWGKRHLAYPINSHEEGYYIVYNIELPGDKAQEFDRKLKLTDGVLRSLRVKEEEL
ncbi:30S ribosomal protein S6 [Candidatus Dojkabacteria bacterium]|uniref:Small ribosomal subunit protein bS6 n=1 Tax=Candidatus Dojkabacteria bacterium TaxID=2099670 RepID=A0A955RKZ2_9BACT|nr:30S ribosomal protein S6 [Candidatus Dojkabacteria bacterium]